MIVKSMSSKNSKQTLKYLFKDESKLQNEDNKRIVIQRNVRGRKLESWIKEFKENETLRKYKRKDQAALIHTVLSFHDKDNSKVNEKVLRTITKEYMRLRGDNLYIATCHYNEAHKHIHICESGTRLDGKSNRLSKRDFEKLRIQLQEFQERKFPELTNSLPNHDKTKKQQRDITQIKTQRNSNKATLLKLLEEAKEKANSKQDFYNSIKEAGHDIYSRNGKETGISFNGETKFRFSRLGFDTKQLDELENTQETAVKELEELDDIRSTSSSQRALNREEQQENEQEELSQEFDMDDELER